MSQTAYNLVISVYK